MKVAELIALLQECPQDGNVYVLDHESGYTYALDADVSPTKEEIKRNTGYTTYPDLTAQDVVLREEGIL